MPRRRRADKRRAHSPLELAIALAAAQAGGCDAVPPQFTLDDLYEAWTPTTVGRGSWASLTFVEGDPRPCERMQRGRDPFTGETIPPPGCTSDRCLFTREAAA